MVAILREADRSSVTEVAEKHKVSEQAIYTWRKRFGEPQPADLKRLHALESENAKLTKLAAERGDRQPGLIQTAGHVRRCSRAIALHSATSFW